ncbi:hypothetical protein [Rhodoferax sp.]
MDDRLDGLQQGRIALARKAAQQHGAGRDGCVRGPGVRGQVVKEVHGR